MQDVEGKVAFITGGSSGVGLGIARAFAEAGMKIVIGYRTNSHMDRAMEQLAGAGNSIHAIKVDVTDRPGMQSAATETVKVFGKIHVLVNNAGVIVSTPLSESTYDDWDWVMSVNLTGVFNGVRAFVPHIKAHGEGGQVVTTSSIAGLIVYGPQGVYSTSKFAEVGMMEALRSELMDKNIGVSVFCPGVVRSNLWDTARNRPAELSDSTTPSPNSLQREQLRAIAENPEPSASWMDPMEAGRLVLRGVRSNDLYILSHPEFEQGIRDRNEALVASIPQDLHVPEARVAAEQALLRNPMYIAERNRKRCSRL